MLGTSLELVSTLPGTLRPPILSTEQVFLLRNCSSGLGKTCRRVRWITSTDFRRCSPNFFLHFCPRACYSSCRNDDCHRRATYVQVVHVDCFDYASEHYFRFR